jgi:hypothetical protein
MTRKLVWSLVLVLASVGLASAQTTGRITGQVIDSSGAAAPGVTVTVTSPQLQGARSTNTDTGGHFRFLSLPPGTYRVKAELPGFKTIDRGGVLVGIDRSVDLSMTLEVAPTAEVITVEAAGPVIDTSSTTTGVNVTADLYTRIPLGRDIYNVSRVAPGTQDDGIGPVVYGSTGAENQYIIEGLNVTGVEVGTREKVLNFDFVQEIEVKTGGLPAEYGRLTGGAINVLTKSGGNDFKGSLFGFYEGGGLQSDNETASKRPNTTTSVPDIDNRFDFGGELGGFLAKDKVWFFGAYNRTSRTDNTTIIRTLTAPGAPALNSVVERKTTRDLYAGKLTWRPAADHLLTVSAFGDPTKEDGNLFVIQGPPSTFAGTLDSGGTDIVARYDGTFGSSFLIRALYGRHREKFTYGGPGRDTSLLLDQTVNPNARTGGWGFFQDQDFRRNVYKLDLTKFLGSHEFKLGGDVEDTKGRTDNYYTGGDLVYRLRRADGLIYYRHRFYLNDLAPGFSRTDPGTYVPAVPLTVEPDVRNMSAYLQDSWKIAKNFTLNLGLRWEKQDLSNRFGESTLKLDKNWSPRVGFVWDVTGNGKSKLYGNYGRFFESIPMDIQFRSFGGEAVCFCYNTNPTPGAFQPNETVRRSALLGSTTPVDPDLKGQHLDEWLGGFEYEVAPNFAVGIKGTYRKLGEVIEDFLIPSLGEYRIANPGRGLGAEMGFYDGTTTAAPKAKRKSYAVELTARKRFSEGWQLLASYVWNKLEGNYDGLFQNSTGQLDPNINSAFDYADFLVNADGILSAERRHQVKFDGSYEFTSGGLDGLNIGLSTYWYSGLPLNAYGYSFLYQNWEYYLVPRGSLGRGPSDYEANVHLSYPIRIGDRAKLNLVVDAFNLFNRQAITQYDERYNLVSDSTCAGIPENLCNTDNGLIAQPNSVIAAGQLTNPRGTATNPDFLSRGIDFTGQRSIRLGVRFQF